MCIYFPLGSMYVTSNLGCAYHDLFDQCFLGEATLRTYAKTMQILDLMSLLFSSTYILMSSLYIYIYI